MGKRNGHSRPFRDKKVTRNSVDYHWNSAKNQKKIHEQKKFRIGLEVVESLYDAKVVQKWRSFLYNESTFGLGKIPYSYNRLKNSKRL